MNICKNKKQQMLKNVVLAVIIIFLFCFSACGSKQASDGQTEDALLVEVIENMEYNMRALDSADAQFRIGLESCYAYIKGECTLSRMADILREQKSLIHDVPLSFASEDLKNRTTEDERFLEPLIIAEAVMQQKEELISELSHLEKLLPVLNGLDSERQITDYLDRISNRMDLSNELYWNICNETLIRCGNAAEVRKFQETIGGLSAFSGCADKWTDDLEELTAWIEAIYREIQFDLTQAAAMVGNLSNSLDWESNDYEVLKQQLIDYYVNELGFDAKTVRLMLEIEEVELEIEDIKETMRQKFAPAADNDSGLLFGKGARFASVKMYDEAMQCMEVFLSKAPDPAAPLCCGETVRALYQEAKDGKRDCFGIIIVSLDEVKEYYQPGDILVALNDTPVYNEQSFMEAKEIREKDYTATVLRLNADDQLEEVVLSMPGDVVVSFNGMEVNDSDKFNGRND